MSNGARPWKVETVHDRVRDPHTIRLPHEQLHAALSRARTRQSRVNARKTVSQEAVSAVPQAMGGMPRHYGWSQKLLPMTAHYRVLHHIRESVVSSHDVWCTLLHG